MMKRTVKWYMLCLCLLVSAGIFMGTFAGAADTTAQPQCMSSSDATVSMGYNWSCYETCVYNHCNHWSRFFRILQI
jgi:hypothetical protein